jgi:hypothetical protein
MKLVRTEFVCKIFPFSLLIKKMADPISKLPRAYEIPSEQDMRVMQTLFGSSSSTCEARGLIVPAILFFILSLPFVDKLLKSIITASDYAIIGVKAGIFTLILLLAQLFNLA